MDKRKIVDDQFVVQRGNPGAIINKDLEALNAYREARIKRFKEQQASNEINTIKEEVNNLKSDISQIKDLLIKVLENK
jgi:hypothetical protein